MADMLKTRQKVLGGAGGGSELLLHHVQQFRRPYLLKILPLKIGNSFDQTNGTSNLVPNLRFVDKQKLWNLPTANNLGIRSKRV